MFFSVIIFLLVLSVLVLVHELGHFLAARRAGMGVEEFGLGYPPRAWAKKIGQTIYSVNWLPVGGFVRLLGEEIDADGKLSQAEAERSFWAKSKKARAAVIIAGVLSNFALAVVCFSVVYSLIGIPTQTHKIEVVGLVEGSPAAEAGLLEGDTILSFNGNEVGEVNQFIGLIGDQKGEVVELEVEREGSEN